MRTKSIGSICLAALVAAGAAAGARGETFRTDINPAQLYYRAFLLAPDLSQADSDYLFTNHWQGHNLPERFGKLIAGYDQQFGLVRQAARSTVPCDWGIDMSPGPATLLPQLARAKAVMVTTRLRVPWLLQNGRQDQARDELIAAFALARNVSRDGLLISTMVQQAGEAINCSTLAANFGRFSPETLKQIQDGLEAIPRRTVADCVQTEKACLFDWTVRKIQESQRQNAGDDARVMEDIKRCLGIADSEEGLTNLWRRLKQASGNSSDGVLRLMREEEQFAQTVIPFLVLPYAEYARQAGAFIAQLEQSPNPLAAEVLPHVIKAREKEFRILAYLAMARAAVEYKLHGEAGLKRVSDPCGDGPLVFRRFVFEGVDRGFELKSAFNLGNNKAVLIFVEKDGPPFQVDGNYPGRALPKAAPQP